MWEHIKRGEITPTVDVKRRLVILERLPYSKVRV